MTASAITTAIATTRRKLGTIKKANRLLHKREIKRLPPPCFHFHDRAQGSRQQLIQIRYPDL